MSHFLNRKINAALARQIVFQQPASLANMTGHNKMHRKTKVLIDNLGFPEGPRWHNGRLWFSDFRLRRVATVDSSGQLEVILELDDQPSGLGWLPDGSLLIVSMINKTLLKLTNGQLTTVADLSALASHWCNDMVVDS